MSKLKKLADERWRSVCSIRVRSKQGRLDKQGMCTMHEDPARSDKEIA
jgi:hypothetical protein